MSDRLRIQAPEVQHLEPIERLIMRAFPEHDRLIFGRRSPELMLEVKLGMYRTTHPAHEGMIVALDHAAVAGVVMYRTAEMVRGLDRAELAALRLLGLGGALRFLLVTTTLLRTYRPPPHVVYIHSLAVSPDYRRRGIGKRLVEQALIAGAQTSKQIARCYINGFNSASRRLIAALDFQQVAQRPSLLGALMFRQPQLLQFDKILVQPKEQL